MAARAVADSDRSLLSWGTLGGPGGQVLLIGVFGGGLAFEGVGFGLVGGQAGDQRAAAPPRFVAVPAACASAWGVGELCDICPQAQRALCRDAHRPPTAGQVQRILAQLGYGTPTLLDGGHLWTHGLTEQQRYPIQHQLGFQVWDLDLPHFAHAHGRSLLGYQPDERERASVAAARERLTAQARLDDD